MARRGRSKRSRRVATPAVAALSDLSPGAELLAAIAALDLSSLPGYDLPLVLRAVYRLGNHTRALLLDVVAEIMRRKDPDGIGTGGWDAVAVHEVRAALAMSRTAANRLNHLAQDLYERLPQVLAAMRDGRLDQPRARVFSSWTALLSEAHARAVVDALLPVAPRLTAGELIDEIRRAAIELDPDFAARNYNHGRSQRRVRGAIDSDGTGHITAEGLSAEQIAAACDRLDAIGWHLKRAGHPDRLDHIRADVFAGLLTGEFAGLTDEELIEKLLASMPPVADPGSSTSDATAADTSGVRSQRPGGAASDDADGPCSDVADEARSDGTGGAPSAGTGGAGDVGCDETPGDCPLAGGSAEATGSDAEGPDADSRSVPDEQGDSSDDGDDGPSEEGPSEGSGGVPAGDGPDWGPAGGGPGRRPAGGESGRRPAGGESDRGPVGGGPAGSGSGAAAPIDRSPVDDQGSGPPPTSPPENAPPGQGPPDLGSREHAGSGVRLRRHGLRLWVALGTLAGRDRRPGELLGWSLVHAELARRIAAAPGASWWYVLVDATGQPLQVGPIRRRPHRRWWDRTTATGRGVEVWLQVTAAELAALVAEPPPGWERVLADIAHRVANGTDGAPNGDPADRFPSIGLRRFLAIRDRRCGFPGCRVPSHRTDVDHIVDYAKGGPTVDANLVHLCRPDHELKTKHGWRVDQLAPGRLRWTSPLGHVYERPAPRGPARAHPPMPHPPGPEHDWFRPWADQWYGCDEDISPTGCLTSDARPRLDTPSQPAAEPPPSWAPCSKPEAKPEPGPGSRPGSGSEPMRVTTAPAPAGGDDVIPF